MVQAKVLSYMPFGGGNSRLWKLRHVVEDDNFLRIFGDIAKLIRKSEKALEEASKENEPEYRDLLEDAECDYLEELIGASFVILQTKIRRVTRAAVALREAMLAEHDIDIDKLSEERIRTLCGNYKETQASLVQLIWDVGNYYKHRDEWPAEVWEDKIQGEKNHLKQARQTRQSVERVGIVWLSTGNLRTAYTFFGVDTYSKCELLAEIVQTWAAKVHETAYAQLKVAVEAHRDNAGENA